MDMSFRVLITALLLVLTATLFVQGQSNGVSKGRTLKFFWQTGPLARQSMEAELRLFVWNCWINKREGKIQAAHYGIDRFPRITKFTIKKDSKQDWYIHVVVSERFGIFGFRKNVLESMRFYNADRVEVISFEGAKEIPTSIGVKDVRDAKLYHLRLKADKRDGDFIF